MNSRGCIANYDMDNIFDGAFSDAFSEGYSEGGTSSAAAPAGTNNPYSYTNSLNGMGPCSKDYDPAASTGGNLFDAAVAAASNGPQYTNTMVTAAAVNRQHRGIARAAAAQMANAFVCNPLNGSLQRTLYMTQSSGLNSSLQQQQQRRMPQQVTYSQSQCVGVGVGGMSVGAAGAGVVSSSHLGMSELEELEPMMLSPETSNRHQLEQRVVSNTSPGTASLQKVLDQGASAISKRPAPLRSLQVDSDLYELQLMVSAVSLHPLSGSEIVSRVRGRTQDVVTRYIPCVDFLVSCQQELRKGLAYATQKRLVRRSYRDTLTPRQFYKTYLEGLPEKFFNGSRTVMEASHLSNAFQGIQNLCMDARKMESHGCETIKNTYLGGMKDGESWGLRKWLSKNGGALQVCTELECILNAAQKLNREDSTTRKLAGLLRPLADKTLKKLRSDIPQSYQEVSSAHPYLPFFHRLEAALRSMSNFDPEDDDVICIEDEDEIQECKIKASQSNCKRKLEDEPEMPAKKAKVEGQIESGKTNSDNDDDDDDDSVIEVIGVKVCSKKASKMDGTKKSWRCNGCNKMNSCNIKICSSCDMGKDFCDLMHCPVFDEVLQNELEEFEPTAFDPEDEEKTDNSPNSFHTTMKAASSPQNFQVRLTETQAAKKPARPDPASAYQMANDLLRLADIFDLNQQSTIRPIDAPFVSFWDGERYGSVLRLFAEIIREPECPPYLESIPKVESVCSVPYASVIKNRLCFRDIFSALIDKDDEVSDTDSKTSSNCIGQLTASGLASWNMWRGGDLLQAIDLVFLNSLAYGRIVESGRSTRRASTNRLRKLLWTGISEILSKHVGRNTEMRRQYTPTRRGESSGFVIVKQRSR